MVSSRLPGVNLSAANSVATSRVSDSDVAHAGNAISSESRRGYRAEVDEQELGGARVNGNSSTGGSSLDDSQWSRNQISMPVDIRNLIDTTNPEDSGNYTTSLEHHAVGTPPPCPVSVKVLANHDEEESYEGFGSVEGDLEDGVDSPGGSSSAPSPTGGTTAPRNPRSPNASIGRHSWLRTSLRRTPPGSSRKRLSSNALASQLYRSGSFNSSGRGSTCDTADDMYSDVSLEDDVVDLSHKVQMIQEQMHALADTQSVSEERYARVKQENAILQARILMLEEAARDAETRSEERLQAEQRRHREWVCRLERERQLQLENYTIKLQAVEMESTSLRDEIARLREQLEKVRNEKAHLENNLEEVRREAEIVRDGERQAVVRANEANNLLQAARDEISMRINDQQIIEELNEQIEQLRAHNKRLEESRDELQAAVALQAGRELLMLNPCNTNAEKGPSLAVELLAGMSQDQADDEVANSYDKSCNIFEIKQALKEQQEVNTQLRAYIDGILLNIVENYPQLLEVKQTH